MIVLDIISEPVIDDIIRVYIKHTYTCTLPVARWLLLQ